LIKETWRREKREWSSGGEKKAKRESRFGVGSSIFFPQ
jgi:hypothetical protein